MTSAIATNITATVILARLAPRTGGLTAVRRALAATVAMTLEFLAAFGAYRAAHRDDRAFCPT
jgi:hypothetical protein